MNDKNTFFHRQLSDGAAQALSLLQSGDVTGAFDLLGRAILQQNHPDDLKLAGEWLSGSNHEEAAVCLLTARMVSAMDQCEDSERTRLYDICINALQKLDASKCIPRKDTTDRYVVECILYRHLNQKEKALNAALNGVRLHGTASCHTFAGLCYLDMEQADKAEPEILRGVELDPQNLSGCNDLADFYFNRRKYQKAEKFYAMVTASGDAYDWEWAEPSLYYCRHLLHADDDSLEQLLLYYAANPHNNRAAWLIKQAELLHMTPYVDYLPRSTEATVNMLDTLVEKGVHDGQMAVTCQEAASCIQAVRLAVSNYGTHPADFSVHANKAPNPPYDELLLPEGMILWDFQPDLNALPAVEKPSHRIAELTAQLAEQPFSLVQWYEQGKKLAEELTAKERDELYACMVWPPRPEQNFPADVWMMRMDYAAVCILAGLGGRYCEAESEAMKRYKEKLPSPELARICLGQLDWPVIPAMTLLGLQMKMGEADINCGSEIFLKLLNRIPAQNYCFCEHALACAMTWIPGQTEGTRRAMRKLRLRLEEVG